MTEKEKIFLERFKPVNDVEMQTGRNRNLPRRSRYYQGIIDLNILAKGEDYINLKKSLVIFVCTFDPFGHGEYIYRCGEYYRLSDGSYQPLGDDAWKIFVNADGHKGNVSDEFKILMRYIMKGEAKNPYTQTLEKKVTTINNNDEWKVSYMTWAIKLADERRDAREEGREEGRKEGREEGDLRRAMKTASNMFNGGEPIDKIAKFLELPPETILSWVGKV